MGMDPRGPSRQPSVRIEQAKDELAGLQRLRDTDALLHRDAQGFSEHPRHRLLSWLRARLGGGSPTGGGEPGDGVTEDAWARELRRRQADGRS